MSPLANAFVRSDQLNRMEPFYPLRVYVCSVCYLVQLDAFETPERLFGHYAYFSSYSETWLEHAQAYAERMADEAELAGRSLVVEIGSNDGYLLQYFQRRGIPVLGIEPAENVARVAEGNGVPTLTQFFGQETARSLTDKGRTADLVIANNVLAHVPDLHDFVRGLKTLLKPEGLLTIEFPHLLRLMEQNQFDTMYHEHHSYFSLMTAERVLACHGLAVVDVEELHTHGGSLRAHVRHAELGRAPLQPVRGLIECERQAGLDRSETYIEFGRRIEETRFEILDFLIDARRRGRTVAAYGAPAKGNTLLNYCGIRSDLIAYTVDRSPHKQGLFLPGSHLPIYAPERVFDTRPDYLFILPWNLREEIMKQMSRIREWGGRFVVPIPQVEVCA